MSAEVKTLDELAVGRTVELKIYQVKDGRWSEFLRCWRAVAALRQAAGFCIDFAVADVPGRRFIWAVSTASDFTEENVKYLSGDDRRAANVISDFIERFEIPKVIEIPIAPKNDGRP
ncbi:hypothetical protein [Microbacterium trichothecenolyticum]|uniref:NIPSNAP domain-containing protein n=1 Tax=Microbacterium trichothecenolyticum TaxID=69370 RepID=A0A0M2HCB4_MICTR|nr:hypothetical protein [Microbacterium trichothecenolyticum]KJL42328.1 hypothetical protein RS82_02344 [Microbacterium trichothecenolyticum]